MRKEKVEKKIIFIFSSRRRHTRCYRDWSSDVCSSDLEGGTYQERLGPRSQGLRGRRAKSRSMPARNPPRWANQAVSPPTASPRETAPPPAARPLRNRT